MEGKKASTYRPTQRESGLKPKKCVWCIDVPGYATLVVGMMFFSGIQLLSIGVLAEYVGRIYEEVKQRPLYVVSQRWGKGL